MNRVFFAALITVLTVRAVVAADFATEMMEATFKLGKSATGTCFLVRREAPDTTVYLVTVGHAFDDNTDKTAVVVLRKPNPDGSFERLEYNFPIRRNDKPLWLRNEKQDLAVVPLTEPLPVAVAALPISALADEARLKASGVHLCSPLFVLAYPLGLEADAAGRPVACQGIFASPPLLPLATHPSFLADYNVFKGDSGGPVFIPGADGHPLVVGLVHEQHYFDDELKGMYQEHRIRNPLGIVKVLHAQHIRDTIEAAAKQNETLSK
jgi:hypothetical protein